MLCSQWRNGYNDDIACGGGCRVCHSSDTHDHADLFVLLLCWVYRHDIQATLKMAQFGTSIPPVLNSARSARVYLGIQYLIVSDTTSYLYGKDNVSALRILKGGGFTGLSMTFGMLSTYCRPTYNCNYVNTKHVSTMMWSVHFHYFGGDNIYYNSP